MSISSMGLLVLFSAAVWAGNTPARVAVVVARTPQGVIFHFAYPPGTTESEVYSDLQRLQQWSSWQLSNRRLASDSAGVTATVQLVDAPKGSQLTLWPFVAALARFDEIVVAYVGPTSPGQGQFDNRYLTVRWQATSAGLTFRVEMKDRSFTSLQDLSASPPVPAQAGPGKPLPWRAVVSVVVLALAAGIMTYCIAHRVLMNPPSRTPAP